MGKAIKPIKKTVKKDTAKNLKKRTDTQNTMRELFEEGRLTKYTCNQLAEMFKIDKNTAAKYRKKIVEEAEPFDLTAMKKRSVKLFERLERNLVGLVDEAEEMEDGKGKIILLERGPKFLKDFTTFLEDYGYKKKAAEEVVVTSEITHTVDLDQLQEISKIE